MRGFATGVGVEADIGAPPPTQLSFMTTRPSPRAGAGAISAVDDPGPFLKGRAHAVRYRLGVPGFGSTKTMTLSTVATTLPSLNSPSPMVMDELPRRRTHVPTSTVPG